MEEKMENINIERNKELFEYEMTEVILKLKGEFAAFSGEGTKFKEVYPADKTVKLPDYHVAEIETVPAALDLPETPASSLYLVQTLELPKAEMSLPKISAPLQYRSPEMDPVCKKMEVPESNPVSNYKKEELKVEKEDFSLPEIMVFPRDREKLPEAVLGKKDIAVPAAGKMHPYTTKIPEPVNRNMVVPVIPEIACYQEKTLTLDRKIPEVTSVPEIKSMPLSTIPKTPEISGYHTGKMEAEKKPMLVPTVPVVQKIARYQAGKVSAEKKLMPVPSVSEISQYQAGQVEAEKKCLQVPAVSEVPEVSRYHVGKVEAETKSLQIPTVPEISNYQGEKMAPDKNGISIPVVPEIQNNKVLQINAAAPELYVPEVNATKAYEKGNAHTNEIEIYVPKISDIQIKPKEGNLSPELEPKAESLTVPKMSFATFKPLSINPGPAIRIPEKTQPPQMADMISQIPGLAKA